VSLLTRLRARLGPRVIYDRDGSRPYLSRYYLLGKRDDSTLPKSGPFNLFVHYFHRGDDDAALHNHPWRWSCSLILRGGYREERREGETIVSRVFRPGRINIIRADDYHRVDLLDPAAGAWSLFLAGPRTGRSWGFWDRVTGRTTPWREFIERKRGHALGKED
jgi:hypothetical protein